MTGAVSRRSRGNPLRRLFPSLVRRERERQEDAMASWLELRDAGVIDPDAPSPWPELVKENTDG